MNLLRNGPALLSQKGQTPRPGSIVDPTRHTHRLDSLQSRSTDQLTQAELEQLVGMTSCLSSFRKVFSEPIYSVKKSDGRDSLRERAMLAQSLLRPRGQVVCNPVDNATERLVSSEFLHGLLAYLLTVGKMRLQNSAKDLHPLDGINP